MNDLNYKLDNPKQAFVDHLLRMAETTVAIAGDWRIRYDNDQYRVTHYGNWRGTFNTLTEALEIVPIYWRKRMKLDRFTEMKQITMFEVS